MEDYVSKYKGEKIDALLDKVDLVDTTPAQGSDALITSGGVYGAIPTKLSELSDDTGHRLVTDTEKQTWNDKQNAIEDLSTIRANASNAYKKPANGIPASDIANGVIPAAPGTLNTNNSDAQSVSSNEALSGSIKLHKVAKTGSYNDLRDKPTIPEQVQSNWTQSDSTKADYIKNKPTIPAAQVNADWNATDGVAKILNKPTIPAAPGSLVTNNSEGLTPSVGEALSGTVNLHKVAKTGSYNDLNDKPTIPEQVQSDWNQSDSTQADFIKNKPTIPAEVNESTVSGWGFTKNQGTITEVRMNDTSKGTSGVVDLGTVLTSHQDISGKADKVNNATNGNLASLDSSGNLVDSGSKASDFATAAQGRKADSAYQKPNDGIPMDDLSQEVQDAIESGSQEGVELVSHKVTALDSSVTDTQYPSAKCVYDVLSAIATIEDDTLVINI